jgi:CheY-like chemotaxis protein
MALVPIRSERALQTAGRDQSDPKTGKRPRLQSDDDAVVRASRTRVIVADDDADARAMMQSMLTGSGFEVTLAHDGRELLELLDRVPPDWFRLVVADHKMPAMFGLEVLARAGSRAKFVIVTGSTDPIVHAAATTLGARAVVIKPVDMPMFLDLVDDLLFGDTKNERGR